VTIALRAAACLVAVCVALHATPAAAQCAGGSVSAPPALIDLYFTAYDQVFSKDLVKEPDGTTYVSTGDINAEWLRDSSAVAAAYIEQAKTDTATRSVLRGIIARQANYILLDAYANAFSADYQVVEHKFEVDSLLYPIWLAYAYWRGTGDGTIFDGHESQAFDRILEVLRTEQHHAERSQYRHAGLPNGGRGAPAGFTGMVWSGFRPSDDPCEYGYNVPVNMFAVTVTRQLTQIEQKVYKSAAHAATAWGMSVQVQQGIEQFGLVGRNDMGRIYAYEVDGLGHQALMDDANPPSLLSIPYFGYLSTSDAAYQATRAFVLSSANPYFFTGTYAQGIGSPHTPRGYVWPLALVMQALTSTDDGETARVLGYIAASVVGDERLHESFDANDPNKYTRGDFAWPNALYTELIAALQPRTNTNAGEVAPCFNGIVNPRAMALPH
jgi:meiotically up-regulated gene 157 (Mug157) protein